MRLVRHHDQDERETDGAVHRNLMRPKLRKTSQKAGGYKFYCAGVDGLRRYEVFVLGFFLFFGELIVVCQCHRSWRTSSR